jgi:hypothetical protein
MPISLRLFGLMCKHIVGYPLPTYMSHDDRMFVAASLVAITGFLRGGEFLTSPSSGRPILRHRDVCIESSDGVRCVKVNVARPKARWWLIDSEVYCSDFDTHAWCNPSVWMTCYRHYSACLLPDDGAAFRLEDGTPLSKPWMLARTCALIEMTGVESVDETGKLVPVKASSWRSGGVASAKEAGLDEGIIREMGRWSSSAWTSYLFTSRADLRVAAKAMWRASTLEAGHLRFVVGAVGRSAAYNRE